MSVIVAVKKADKIVIAADTLYSFGTTKVSPTYIRKQDKIHRCGNSYIGIIGASAHDGVFQHLIENHSEKLSFGSKSDIFNTYLKIHPILKDNYFINTSEGGDDESYESSQIDALIANSNGIFGMYSWREVYEFERFWALGSGMEYALGAMFMVYDIFDDAEKIADAAINAACEFDDGCGLPMTVYSIKLQKTVLK